MTKSQINKHVSDLSAEVATIVEKYQELYDDMQSYFDDKSENWQTSEKGDDYQSMMDEVPIADRSPRKRCRIRDRLRRS